MEDETIAQDPCGLACIRKLPARIRVTNEGAEEVDESVAVEAAVKIVYNNEFYVSTSMSPREFNDYVVGSAFALGLIDCYEDIVSIDVSLDANPIEVHVAVREGLDLKTRSQTQSSTSGFKVVTGIEGSSSSGASSLSAPSASSAPSSAKHTEDLEQPLHTPRQLLKPQAIWKISESLLTLQGMHQITGATHAASFVDFDGAVCFIREDVGRHSAVDKLIGALLTNKVSPDEGFVFLSSRCALELVEKLLRYGIKIIATISAPTSAVIDLAIEKDITICAFARGKRFTIYTHPERLLLPK